MSHSHTWVVSLFSDILNSNYIFVIIILLAREDCSTCLRFATKKQEQASLTVRIIDI